MVVALEGVGSSLEGIPNLLAALEGRGCVPELIPLTAELPVRHGVIALPFGLLLLQRLVTTESHCGGERERGNSSKEQHKIGFGLFHSGFTELSLFPGNPRRCCSSPPERCSKRGIIYAYSNFHLLRELWFYQSLVWSKKDSEAPQSSQEVKPPWSLGEGRCCGCGPCHCPLLLLIRIWLWFCANVSSCLLISPGNPGIHPGLNRIYLLLNKHKPICFALSTAIFV